MAQLFEPGQYIGRVTSWSLVKAKNENKTPTFALTFQVVGKVNARNPDAEPEPCSGAERTIFRPITENTADWLLRDVKELFEYPHDSFGPLDPESDGAFDFRDAEFPAHLAYEDFDGKTREKWNFATGMYLGEPLTATEIKKLDHLFGAAKPKRNGRKPKPKPQLPEAEPASAPPQEVPI